MPSVWVGAASRQKLKELAPPAHCTSSIIIHDCPEHHYRSTSQATERSAHKLNASSGQPLHSSKQHTHYKAGLLILIEWAACEASIGQVWEVEHHIADHKDKDQDTRISVDQEQRNTSHICFIKQGDIFNWYFLYHVRTVYFNRISDCLNVCRVLSLISARCKTTKIIIVEVIMCAYHYEHLAVLSDSKIREKLCKKFERP